jgi:hypothetical protein
MIQVNDILWKAEGESFIKQYIGPKFQYGKTWVACCFWLESMAGNERSGQAPVLQ